MRLQEHMNRVAYVFKKGPFVKPSLYDAVACIDASDLAETIRRGRLDEQHGSRYHYNQFVYRMGPDSRMQN